MLLVSFQAGIEEEDAGTEDGSRIYHIVFESI
jgi:hypothetical protein